MYTILGAGGSVSNELVKLLAARNLPFRTVSRHPNSTPGAAETRTADLTRHEQTVEAVSGSDFVFLLAGLNYDHKLWAEQWPRIIDNVVDACKRLEASGANVVGLNCQRGPKTLMPVVRTIREVLSCHVASLPVPYRTTDAEPTFQSLTDRSCACIPGNRPFPTALDPFTCNRYECAEYAREAQDIGVRYIGLCCGNAPHHIRAVAEALGRKVPGSRYSPDMSKHAFFGTDATIPDKYKKRKREI